MRLYIYSLINCPYSMKAEILLVKYNPEIIKVKSSKKSYYNDLNNMQTFPQIFLIDEESDYKIKIGGYDDTKILLKKIFNNKKIDYSKDDSIILENFFLNKK